MLKPVLHAFQMFLKGATGKDRQAKHHLSDHLFKVQVAYDQLQQQFDQLQLENERLLKTTDDLEKQLQRNQTELEELITLADTDAKFLISENQSLQLRLRDSEDEKESLQVARGQLLGRVAVLERQLDLEGYRTGNGQATANRAELGSVEAADFSEVSLANISLALVGGHETTYREVRKALRQYGLKRCIHVPPHSIASNSRQQIKDKIGNCDLVVTITSYVDHSVSKCVKQLKDAQLLAGECIRVSCHGKSGLVREVLQYFAEPAATI
ncbi:MAG: DUF2325 domain-containing protein [Cyanobacteria bacterium J06614_10]